MLDDDDLQEEIRAHLKIAADEKIAGGADPNAASLEARKEFGNLTLTAEAARRIVRYEFPTRADRSARPT